MAKKKQRALKWDIYHCEGTAIETPHGIIIEHNRTQGDRCPDQISCPIGGAGAKYVGSVKKLEDLIKQETEK